VSKGGLPTLLCVDFSPCCNADSPEGGSGFSWWCLESSSKLSSKLGTIFPKKITYLIKGIWLFSKTEGTFASVGILYLIRAISTEIRTSLVSTIARALLGLSAFQITE
jgi:hypothetical protein